MVIDEDLNIAFIEDMFDTSSDSCTIRSTLKVYYYILAIDKHLPG